MRSENKNLKGGFTLIETLVAISILVISVTGPLALASKGLSYSSYAKDEITAFYLANEAVDAIRNIRDTNIRSSKEWLAVPGGTGSSDVLISNPSKCGGGDGCYFDVWNNPPNLKSAFAAGSSGSTLKTCDFGISNNLLIFGHSFSFLNECKNLNNEPSIFSRNIKIEEISFDPSGKPTEVRITVTVSWTTKAGIARDVVITENLFRITNI